MINGLLGLFDSKKGTVFGTVAAALTAMMVQGAVPAILGAKLLVLLAGTHMIGQGIADFGKGKGNEEPPQTGL